MDFQELVDGRDHTAIRPENRFRAGGSDCLLADAILKPSAGEFQRLADGRDRVATAGIFWRESNFYFVVAIAPPGGGLSPKKSINQATVFFGAHIDSICRHFNHYRRFDFAKKGSQTG